MKKYLIYFLIFTFLIFIFPALCTKNRAKAIDSNDILENKEKIEKKESDENIEIEENKKNSGLKYEYKKHNTIKLLHSKTGIIEEVPLDEYIYCTVSAEMPVEYEIEALKSQAVVSRTYTIYQIEKNNNKHGDADICDDFNCCQAWISKEERMKRWDDNIEKENWNKIVRAVDETKGKVITYNGEAINAFFHSNSGGKTEIVSNVWGGRDFPYIQSVETSGENEYEGYSSEVTIKKDDFINKIKEKYPNNSIDFNKNDCIKILEYTGSGRVKTLKVGNINISGTEIRKILGLKSTNFTFKIEENSIIFSVIGYGHGVGMSQSGANSMAKRGSTYEQIIKHFYTNVKIENW